jgi:hypothetical protein
VAGPEERSTRPAPGIPPRRCQPLGYGRIEGWSWRPHRRGGRPRGRRTRPRRDILINSPARGRDPDTHRELSPQAGGAIAPSTPAEDRCGSWCVGANMEPSLGLHRPAWRSPSAGLRSRPRATALSLSLASSASHAHCALATVPRGRYAADVGRCWRLCRGLPPGAGEPPLRGPAIPGAACARRPMLIDASPRPTRKTRRASPSEVS